MPVLARTDTWTPGRRLHTAPGPPAAPYRQRPPNARRNTASLDTARRHRFGGPLVVASHCCSNWNRRERKLAEPALGRSRHRGRPQRGEENAASSVPLGLPDLSVGLRVSLRPPCAHDACGSDSNRSRRGPWGAWRTRTRHVRPPRRRGSTGRIHGRCVASTRRMYPIVSPQSRQAHQPTAYTKGTAPEHATTQALARCSAGAKATSPARSPSHTTRLPHRCGGQLSQCEPYSPASGMPTNRHQPAATPKVMPPTTGSCQSHVGAHQEQGRRRHRAQQVEHVRSYHPIFNADSSPAAPDR